MVDLRGEREHGGAAPGEAPLRSRSRWPFWPVVLVVVVGFAVTAALAWVSAHDYATNEQRLIQLRARDVAAALTSALPSIQTPLASAAALADATDGNRAKFERFIAPYVGVGNGRPFASVSLWRISDLDGGPVAVAGTTPVLARAPASAVAFLRHADASSSLSVIGLLSGPSPRLGYAYPGTPMGRFVAYAEGLIPPGRYAPPRRGAAFADLGYALYLGARPSRADLLIASRRRRAAHAGSGDPGGAPDRAPARHRAAGAPAGGGGTGDAPALRRAADHRPDAPARAAARLAAPAARASDRRPLRRRGRGRGHRRRLVRRDRAGRPAAAPGGRRRVGQGTAGRHHDGHAALRHPGLRGRGR